MQYAIEKTWSYAAASSGIAGTSTAVTVKAAPDDIAAAIAVTGLSIDAASNTALEFTVQDSTGVVLARIPITTAGKNGSVYPFNPPLIGTKGAGMQMKCSTTFTGAVYANLQGYEVIV